MTVRSVTAYTKPAQNTLSQGPVVMVMVGTAMAMSTVTTMTIVLIRLGQWGDQISGTGCAHMAATTSG